VKKPTAVILFLLFAALFALLLMPRVLQVRELDQRSADLGQDILRLRKENEKLETELRLLRDDPVYLEKVARQKFNKAKEGEIVYKVVREGDSTAPGTNDKF
jgi:cell division protein DivIC